MSNRGVRIQSLGRRHGDVLLLRCTSKLMVLVRLLEGYSLEPAVRVTYTLGREMGKVKHHNITP